MQPEPPTPQTPESPLSARDRLGPALLRPKEAAAYLNISMKTLRRVGVRRVRYTNRTFRYRIAYLYEAREQMAARALARANKPPASRRSRRRGDTPHWY